MKAFQLFTCVFLLVFFSGCSENQTSSFADEFNTIYSGDRLNRVAFPLGGMGAGMICLEGSGAISHVSVRHQPDVFHEPFMFGAMAVKGLQNGN